MPGGRLLVVDYQNKRYSVFDTAGTFLMSAPRRLFPGSVVKPWQGAVDSQGRVIEWQRVMSSDDPARLRGVLIRTDSTFAPRDTLDLALPEIDEVLVAVGGGVARYTILLAPSLRWRLDGRRGHFWSSGSMDYRLVQASIAGDTLMIVEREYKPIPVRPEERDEAAEYLRRVGARVPASRNPQYRQAFSSFLIDSEGFLWVVPTLERRIRVRRVRSRGELPGPGILSGRAGAVPDSRHHRRRDLRRGGGRPGRGVRRAPGDRAAELNPSARGLCRPAHHVPGEHSGSPGGVSASQEPEARPSPWRRGSPPARVLPGGTGRETPGSSTADRSMATNDSS